MTNPENNRGRFVYTKESGEKIYEATPAPEQPGQIETPEWEEAFHQQYGGIGSDLKRKNKTVND